MTLLVDALRSRAQSVDDTVYPSDIYFHLLKRVAEAKTGGELGEALVHLLAWKNGKVRRDPAGAYKAQPNRRYSVAGTKRNTVDGKQEGVLKSEAFFAWASPIRVARHFDGSLIESLQEQFPLWKDIAYSVFVLHCLRPPIYPVVDPYVFAAFNALRASDLSRFKVADITVAGYEAYHRWWLEVLKEAEIPQLSAELNELKDIHAGLWALGKGMLQQAQELSAITENDGGAVVKGQKGSSEGAATASGKAAAVPPHGTDSREFKARAVALWLGGKTQAEAIQEAATEMGIALKQSYTAYPGSHFDRWRKQGFWSKAEALHGK